MQLLAQSPGSWLDPFCADFAYTPRARVDVLWFSYMVHSRVFVYVIERALFACRKKICRPFCFQLSLCFLWFYENVCILAI